MSVYIPVYAVVGENEENDWVSYHVNFTPNKNSNEVIGSFRSIVGPPHNSNRQNRHSQDAFDKGFDRGTSIEANYIN